MSYLDSRTGTAIAYVKKRESTTKGHDGLFFLYTLSLWERAGVRVLEARRY